jgi:hypothetical protein
MKRQAYGFRDLEFFKLKILAIHQAKYALVGWTIKKAVSGQLSAVSFQLKDRVRFLGHKLPSTAWLEYPVPKENLGPG